MLLKIYLLSYIQLRGATVKHVSQAPPQQPSSVVPDAVVPAKEEQEDNNAPQEATADSVAVEANSELNKINQSTKKIAMKWLARARAVLYNAR